MAFQMAMQKSVKIIVNLQFVYLLRLTYKYLPLLIHKESAIESQQESQQKSQQEILIS